MRRALLAPVALLAGLAACQEIATSPKSADLSSRAVREVQGDEFPPPPGSDTGAVAPSSELGAFSLNVTYFLNKPGTSGFLSFQKVQPEGVSVDPNARVRYSQGEFIGTGEVRIQREGIGTLTLDLATVGDGSVFDACDAPQGEVTVPTAAEVEDGDGSRVSCFRVVIGGGTFTPEGGSSTPSNGVTLSPCEPIRGACLKPGSVPTSQ